MELCIKYFRLEVKVEHKNQHEVTWTPDRISNYWDYISTNPYLSSVYFTKQVGKGVVRDFLKTNKIDGMDILDFGCGPGNLFNGLNALAPNFNYYGADFSQTSIEVLKETFKNEKNFKDAFHIKSFPINHDKKYDFIICCEVIEHLDDKTLDEVAFELNKLLKPGGVLYITTPNDENLDAAKSMCPECGCVFHRWQHMRSWSEKTVSAYFSLKGFKTIETKTLNFDNSPIKAQLKTIVKSYVLKIAPKSLVYIGRKM